VHGVLILDKPQGMSSAAAVDHVKRTLGVARAGHGGTLDPLATGVLAICLDAATKLAPYLLADDKAYEADGVLGIETDTLDRTGTVTREQVATTTEAALREVLARRMGEQDQVPPMFSAIKQGGVRLYERARAGEEVAREPRRIRIDRLELLAFEPPRFRVAIACSKGTYVRSLVADIGTDLGCGAHLAELRRTQSGRFTLAHAITLDAITGRANFAEKEARPPLIELAHVTGMPSIPVPERMLKHALSGVQFDERTFGELPKAERFQMVEHFEGGKTLYDRVFPELFVA